jgi:serine/threonine-protein kinase
MKLVRGGRLDEHAHAGRSLPELLRIVGRICEAVAFAHAHGVIHRDLKPENIMVGAFGEVLVMDWGVAKLRGDAATAGQSTEKGSTRVADESPHTGDGTVLGTPGYMPPEQASGAVQLIDERTDVYALGAILSFVMGIGGAPMPRPLAAIAARARAAEPAARYQRVDDLAADLEAWLAGLPVSAYRERLDERLWRVAVRHRTPIHSAPPATPRYAPRAAPPRSAPPTTRTR